MLTTKLPGRSVTSLLRRSIFCAEPRVLEQINNLIPRIAHDGHISQFETLLKKCPAQTLCLSNIDCSIEKTSITVKTLEVFAKATNSMRLDRQFNEQGDNLAHKATKVGNYELVKYLIASRPLEGNYGREVCSPIIDINVRNKEGQNVAEIELDKENPCALFLKHVLYHDVELTSLDLKRAFKVIVEHENAISSTAQSKPGF